MIRVKISPEIETDWLGDEKRMTTDAPYQEPVLMVFCRGANRPVESPRDDR